MTSATTPSPRTRWLIILLFALLVGVSFFARHAAGSALAGRNYTALVMNPDALIKPAGDYMQAPNNLLWDETLAYARYVQQFERGDWFGNTFDRYAAYARAGSMPATAHYPFFFDRGGVVLVALLAKLSGDVSRAFALADFVVPFLLALCAVIFCLQLRNSLPFALLASACFLWFNWSDTATWYRILTSARIDDGMVFSRTPYPQVAILTLLIFAIVLLRLMRTPNGLWAILLALAITLNAVTYVYSWLIALAIVGVIIVLCLVKQWLGLPLTRNVLFAALGGLVLSLVLSSPAWATYLLAPEIARDVVGRFAGGLIDEPDTLLRSVLLVFFVVPLLPPWLKQMQSRAFWIAFWVGGILAYNQQLITGMEVQPGHYPPYYFGTFALIYLIDLALMVWEQLAPASFRGFNARILPLLAAIVVIGGFLAITWRNVTLARAQSAYNQTNANVVELINTLNHINGDVIVLTTDDYLQAVLPAYVNQRFVLPLFTDPMTNVEVTRTQDAAARLLGYANWQAWSKNNRDTALAPLPWEFDPNRVVIVVNRHRASRNPAQFSNVLLSNDDFLVGLVPQ